MKNKKLVIFGASNGAVKVIHLLRNLNIEIEFLVDNDTKKWGHELCGLTIFPPSSIYNGNYNLIIASDYQEEIEIQLKEHNILNNIILKEYFIIKYIEKHIDHFQKIVNQNIHFHFNQTIIIELIDAGICLGGIETWALMITRELIKDHIPTELFIRNTNSIIPEDIKHQTTIFDINYEQYIDNIKKITVELAKRLPCVLVSNWQSQTMFAAIIIKKFFPDKIRIVSIIHNDKISLYRRQLFLESYTDCIMGVSKKINKTFINNFGMSSEKIFYKETPVDYEANFFKKYTQDKKFPLQIGYAARITKFQKRADLLLEIIKIIKKKNLNCQLNIAGDGEWFPLLKNYVSENKLESKVHLYGYIPREKIKEFWKNQDIFLSISDFEGTSISMLEAMSFGAIPIVTCVSGVDEFVYNNITGFCVPVKDINQIIYYIEYLIKHREDLSRIGKQVREIIYKKCNKDTYIEFIKKKLLHISNS